MCVCVCVRGCVYVHSLTSTSQTLPSPQMSDQELEEIAKINSTVTSLDDGEGAAATRALMPAYGATPSRAALTARTPVARTPAREDRVRMEAENVWVVCEFVWVVCRRFVFGVVCDRVCLVCVWEWHGLLL